MRNFLVVDFEFTNYRGFGKPRGYFHEVIEIGAVLLSGTDQEEKGRLQNFVKPKFFPKQAKSSYEFCMITPYDMQKAIDFPKMVERLAKLYVPGETWFVEWGAEDFKVLDLGCKKHKIPNPIREEDCLDLAEAYRLLVDSNNTIGLKAATEAENVDTEGLWHTALDDADNTGRLLVKLLEKGWTVERFHRQVEELQEHKREEKAASFQRWLAKKQMQEARLCMA